MVNNTEYEILDRISDAFFAVDQDWNVTYFNIEATKLLGRDKEEVLYGNLWEKFPEAKYEEVYRQYYKAVKEQVPVFFEMYWPPRDMWYSVRAYPSENGLSVFFQDITEQKQQATLRDDQYKSLFMNNSEAVFSFDLEGNYISINPAMEKLLGYSKDEYLSMNYSPLVIEEEIKKVNSYFSKAASGVTQHYETKSRHKNGRIIDVKVTNMPITIDGEIVGVYGMARDVTEEKKTEKLLLESEKLTAVGQLAASIAHEIRNPLTSIKGFIQLMKTSDDISKAEYFDILADEVTRIELITGELLMLAKPQAHDFHYADISVIIEDVVTLLSSQALMNHVDFNMKIESLPKIKCIENQLKQAFINVIKNGIEAMPHGGMIYITVNEADTNIVIEIKDEGLGIPKTILNKIGSPFYTTKEKGTGLGMMTTIKIIQTHNGTFTISNTNKDGTTIRITLPIKQEFN
ncbi:PAS domain S-box protein [Evansella cellulosilytica]|uniref:histidine kinase n=1 Tax=Evansella cellulosilytica (strain ATCC 21833 / DSM 2522 / FERM P-1141 / JCM 9156 / N-4) TaxID=649639 RepID=E6TYE0_EVAC2|nr:PAS domain S-box protein [Evansella cellulosilytica]ADU28878.1 PAS/PAC sensor signal transduction histidine kinase [Evansella cellulosilytica DSM 2522]